MLKAGAATLAVVGLTGQIMTVHTGLSEWAPCPQYGNLSCAYLDVPLDYHNASSGNGQLLVVKANATGERKGTIFLNPGELAYENLLHFFVFSQHTMTRRPWRIRSLVFGYRRGGLDEPDRRSLRLRQLGSPRGRPVHLVRARPQFPTKYMRS